MTFFLHKWLCMLNTSVLVVFIMSCDRPEPEPDMSQSANLIFHETFEGVEPFSAAHNKEVGDWDYALQYVNSPVQGGTFSARFEIQRDQPLIAEGKRSEVTIIMGTNAQLTRKAWYSFAIYFPSEGFLTDPTHDVISQWYRDGSPVRLLAKGDRIVVDIGSDSASKEEIDIADLTKDTWHEFVFHFIHSPNNDGYLAVWHNGEQKVDRIGGNTYNEFLPKWKIGIYKAAFELGTSTLTNRVVFFDNVKVGNEHATYRDMEPARP